MLIDSLTDYKEALKRKAAEAFQQRTRVNMSLEFLVVDENEAPVGILSQTDLALNQGLEPYLKLREVRAVVARPPLLANGTQSLAEVASQMQNEKPTRTILAVIKIFFDKALPKMFGYYQSLLPS